MEKFEYKTFVYEAKGVLTAKVDTDSIDLQLNGLGADGWEVVGCATLINPNYAGSKVLYTLKRPAK